MVYRVDTFEENKINPITQKEWDDSWIVLILTHNTATKMVVGSENGCAYTMRVSRNADENWFWAAGDAVGYCENVGKNIILVMAKTDFQEMTKLYEDHCFNEARLRNHEAGILVHSTTRESWTNIKKDGKLKCWNLLKREQVLREKQPIGLELGDPEEFSNYIMFGGFGVSGEIVVSSRQCGFVNMDVNAEYETGARLYFDARKIAEDGLLIRDGAHIKVKDILHLEKYLIWAATWENVGLDSKISTPYEFATNADNMFKEKFGQYI